MKNLYSSTAVAVALLLGAVSAQAADGTFCSWGGACTTRAQAEAAAQQSHGSYASKIVVRMDEKQGSWVADVTSKWSGETTTNSLGMIPYTFTDEAIVGPEGPQGPQGETGPQGPAGKDGNDGLPGKDGKDGKDGNDGKDGAKGDRGEKGDTGEKGEAGRDGKDGADGRDGKDGATGAAGEKGETGAAGRDGSDGTNGTDGRDGVDGAAGKDGAQGERGERGSDGRDGTDGVDGKDGAKGAKGDRGKQGVKGDKGDRGVAGRDGKDADEERVKALEAAANRQKAETDSLKRDVKDLRGGIAGATALSVMQQTPLGRPGELQVSAGVGYYDGETAGALLVGTNFTERLYGNVGAFMGSTGEPGIAASVTYTFGN